VSGLRVGILGAGRQALETAGYCQMLGDTVAFFVEEHPPDYARDPAPYGAPILTFDDDLTRFEPMAVIGAVGDPGLRRRLAERWPGTALHTVVAPQAWIAPDAALSEGTLVAPMAALNRFCILGRHVLVNVGTTLAHDVVVGDFTTLSPGCTVGGLASIGSDVFVGIGATVRDRVRIGDGALVAAGAVVVADVEPGRTVMGVPATARAGTRTDPGSAR
jgi:sugar O-acyltransferase (sialic acid O-acetyltransferase NeuD family)